MIKIEISFPVIDIVGSKSENLIFPDIFLNKDIRLRYYYEFLYQHSSYPFRGKRVSDFSFRP